MLRLYSRSGDCLVSRDLIVAGGDHPSGDERAPVWIDIVRPSAEDDHFAEELAGLSIPTRDEMQEIEVSSRLYAANGAEYMTVTAIARLDSETPVATPVTFIVKGDCLLTVRYEDLRPFETFTTRAQRPGLAIASGEQIMFGLLESMIDRLADAMERVGADIDSISHAVFRHRSAAGHASKDRDFQLAIVRIGRAGDLLGLLRESLVSVNRLLTWHTAAQTAERKMQENKQAAKQNGKETNARIKLMQRDALALTDHASYLSSKVAFLLDATLGLINLEQNQIIKIFSIAAVCLMPPTLVASIYGMNFKMIPELDFTYGYPMALGMMIVSAIVPVVYFRSKGWL